MTTTVVATMDSDSKVVLGIVIFVVLLLLTALGVLGDIVEGAVWAVYVVYLILVGCGIVWFYVSLFRGD